jgi:hypothetical protein
MPYRVLQRMVRPERFELPTSWFVAMRSIQLSYGRSAEVAGGESRPSLKAAARGAHLHERLQATGPCLGEKRCRAPFGPPAQKIFP